ncbi:hypothetical protein T261_3505 [Streptomyces lydicus]|nr:hypothetical protein T261_3505 [Streptomyces lydicus]
MTSMMKCRHNVMIDAQLRHGEASMVPTGESTALGQDHRNNGRTPDSAPGSNPDESPTNP